ncbi:S41 family peptidase [Paludibaculum fermentans]|uniref:S41 family peptidase n=1 Tax=Paludibaculum fermentans TaxID=1473598 RepID=UPI003EB91546
MPDPMRNPIILRRLAPALFGLALFAASIAPGFAQPATPAGPAGEVLQAFLKAFNSGDRSSLETFVSSYQPPDTAEGLLSLRKLTGGFTLLSIEQSAADAIRIRVRGNGDNLEAYGRILLATTAPPRVNWLGFRLIPPGGVIEDLPLDAAGRKRVIEAVLSALKRNYVYPETAEKMAAAINSHQEKGRYDTITDGGLLANQIGEDLNAVSHDRHLRVEWSPFQRPQQRPGPDPADEARIKRELERNNCTFEKLEILPNNVGYLKFNAFAAPAICGPTVAAAMSFLAHVDALVFDLRDNRGGDPRMVALIATYLFDHPVHLSDIYNRRENSTTQYWTLPSVPGKRLPSTPTFVLTSSRTFSGAEDFAYNLQAIQRVTVIGETTGGGAHPTMLQPVDAHFSVAVPFARSINLATKTNWEGTGVIPDVQVQSAAALEVAHRRAIDEIRAKRTSN